MLPLHTPPFFLSFHTKTAILLLRMLSYISFSKDTTYKFLQVLFQEPCMVPFPKHHGFFSKNPIVQQPCLWHRSSLSCLASSLVSQSFSKAALILEITPWYWAHLAAEHSTMRCSLPPSVEPCRYALSGFLAHVILSLFQGFLQAFSKAAGFLAIVFGLCHGLCLGFGLSLGLCLWLFQARPS